MWFTIAEKDALAPRLDGELGITCQLKILVAWPSYQIISSPTQSLTTLTMPIAPDDLKAAVRAAINVTHIEVEDNSSGCGDNFYVLIVSRVIHMLSYSFLTAALNCDIIFLLTQEFEGKTTLARHRMGIISLSSLVAFHSFSRFQPTQ